MKLGSKGPEVKELQQKLNQLGYKLVVDCDFGPKTEYAVKAYQKANNLTPDGIVGPKTLAKLQQRQPPAERLHITPAPRRIQGAALPKDKVKYIVMHHTAATIDLSWEFIDKFHLSKFHGAGFGYHFKINKKGEIQAGRPLNVKGEQAKGINSISVGVVFDGNFDIDKPTPEQIESGKKLVKWLKGIFSAVVIGHKDAHKINREATVTACPGRNFPLNEFKEV